MLKGLPFIAQTVLSLSVIAVIGPMSAANATWLTDTVVADPIAHEKQETQKDCGQPVTYTDDFATEDDINGDGLMDVIINHGGAQCAGMLSFWCGSGGCSGGIYVATGPDEFVRTTLPTTINKIAFDGRPAIEIGQHGSTCGRVGANWCMQVLEWVDGDFLKRDDNFSPREWQLSTLGEDVGGAPLATISGYRGAALSILCGENHPTVEYALAPMTQTEGVTRGDFADFVFNVDGRINVLGMSLKSGSLTDGSVWSATPWEGHPLLPALRGGSSVTISEEDGITFGTFSLRGSGRAIGAVVTGCG